MLLKINKVQLELTHQRPNTNRGGGKINITNYHSFVRIIFVKYGIHLSEFYAAQFTCYIMGSKLKPNNWHLNMTYNYDFQAASIYVTGEKIATEFGSWNWWCFASANQYVSYWLIKHMFWAPINGKIIKYAYYISTCSANCAASSASFCTKIYHRKSVSNNSITAAHTGAG